MKEFGANLGTKRDENWRTKKKKINVYTRVCQFSFFEISPLDGELEGENSPRFFDLLESISPIGFDQIKVLKVSFHGLPLFVSNSLCLLSSISEIDLARYRKEEKKGSFSGPRCSVYTPVQRDAILSGGKLASPQVL